METNHGQVQKPRMEFQIEPTTAYLWRIALTHGELSLSIRFTSLLVSKLQIFLHGKELLEVS